MTTVDAEQVRREHDLIGAVEVPTGAYWGAPSPLPAPSRVCAPSAGRRPSPG